MTIEKIAMRFLIDKYRQVCYNERKAYCKDGRRFKSSSRNGGELGGHIISCNTITSFNTGRYQSNI